MKSDTMIFKRESMRLLLTLVQDKIAALVALEEVLLDMDKVGRMNEADIEEVRQQIRENNADGSNAEPTSDLRKTMPDTGDTTVEFDMPIRWENVKHVDKQTISATNIPTAIQIGHAKTRTRKIGFEHGD